MQNIGGFRIVRRLGAGTRAEIFLGSAGLPGEPQRTAALKVFRASTTLSSIDTEIEALARASSRHLLRLDDLAMDAAGRPTLVLQRLGPVSLAQLLINRREVAPGEAVTILAPIIGAVGELHRVGVAHLRLRLGSVLFDSEWAPVLAGFGTATLVGPMPPEQRGSSLSSADLDLNADVRHDLDDLRALVRAVLELVDADERVDELLRWIGSGPVTDETFSGELTDRLFSLAQALPVGSERPIAPVMSRVGGITERDPGGALKAIGRSDTARHGVDIPASTAFRRSAILVATWLREFLAPVRKSVWIAAAVVGALLVTSLAVVPAGGSTSRSSDSAQPTASASRDPSRASALASSSQALPGTERNTPTRTIAPLNDGVASADDNAAIAGDDPLRAARVLLAKRDVCLAAASPGPTCLAEVDQGGSAAEEADRHRIEASNGVGASAVPLADFDIRLVQLLGGTAILSVSPPGEDVAALSLLLVRGEEGWRLRDLDPALTPG